MTLPTKGKNKTSSGVLFRVFCFGDLFWSFHYHVLVFGNAPETLQEKCRNNTNITQMCSRYPSCLPRLYQAGYEGAILLLQTQLPLHYDKLLTATTAHHDMILVIIVE